MIGTILEWLRASWLHEAMRDTLGLFVFFETVHFIGLSLLFGAMIFVDLRLLGLLRLGSLNSVLKFTHLAAVGLGVNVISGIALVASDPQLYWAIPLFRIKMALILLAGLNVLWFETVERRKVLALVDGVDTGPDTKLVAGLSLTLWTVIIVIGRFLPTMSST